MTVCVLGAVFRPAAALVGRLRYAQKFALVALVLLLPMGFVAAAYVQLQHSQIEFSARERRGVEYLAPLEALTAEVAADRHRSLTAPGDAGPAATGTGTGTATTTATTKQALAAVDRADHRLGASLTTTPAWASARRLVTAALQADGPPTDRLNAYNNAVDALSALMIRVGDASNLTLDPDLDTYYLMDIVQFRLPVLLDSAGRGVDAVLAAGPPGASDPGVTIEQGLANGAMTTTRTAIDRGAATIAAHTADAGVRAGTTSDTRRLDTAVATLTGVLTAAGESTHGAAVRADAAVPVQSAAAQYARNATAALDRLLQARIDRFTARARWVETASAFTALLGGYLFAGFYLSVVPPIRRIVTTLHTVAAGDLTRRVAIDTHDELSFVARALNDTVARTEIATNRLVHQATHDALTGLPSRIVVLDRLDEALNSPRRPAPLVAVLFIDLDRFKPVNDSLGHAAGDHMLRTVAERLTAHVAATGTVARLAGDEFVVITDTLTTVDAAIRLAEGIVTALSEPVTVPARPAARVVTVGASVGIACAHGRTEPAPAPDPGTRPGRHRTADAPAEVTSESLLRDADIAMYQAKQRGRGSVQVFDDALRVSLAHRVQAEADLRQAVVDGQIRPHYQPIVDAATGCVVGFEALARWEHPERGLLPPVEFIEVAEDTGLIVPLGAAILTQACAQAVRWRRERPGTPLDMAVNVSATQLAHPSFVGTVAAVLADTGLDPDALWLEITETSIMVDDERTIGTLRAIRALGVHLAVDDFGTGYSSLAHLRRFPVEALKIDRSFVAGMGTSHEDDAIVGMIVDLARSLQLRVVAEGVETAAQYARLRHLDCPLVQGFHLGRPVPAVRAGQLLDQLQPQPV